MAVGQTIVAPKPLKNRIFKVLRLRIGEKIALFNGKDGLFEAEICANEDLKILSCLKEFVEREEVLLLVAVLKKENFNNVLRQATEMGVTTIQPVMTAHCVPKKLNLERAEGKIIEAAEQCERLDLPILKSPVKLHDIFSLLTAGVPKVAAAENGKNPHCPPQVYWCDEVEGGKWGDHVSQPGDAVLVGPEGGFSADERAWLAAQPNIIRVGLGDLILRADTAVISALSRFLDHKN